MRPVVGASSLAVAALLLSACGSPVHPQAATTSVPATSTPTTQPVPTTATTVAPTTVAPTTTTTAAPPDPGSSPDAVSESLIQAWEKGDRGAAATVATRAAVDALFAGAYGGEVLNDRGCGAPGPNPVVCTWGPYADASPASPTYDITVEPKGSAWYVADVTKLS